MYRYTPQQIADMTPHQTAALIEPNQVAKVLEFDTAEEYERWIRRQSS